MTHGLQYLSQCDVIALINDGSIRSLGPLPQLLVTDRTFAEFCNKYNVEIVQDDEDSM